MGVPPAAGHNESMCDCPCRRRFLVSAASTAAVGAVSLTVVGCGDVEVDELAEDVEIDLSEHPDLQVVGKSVTIELDQIALPLAITRASEEENDFIVTGTECNHRGCGVERNGDGWRCPCHGARFALDGALEKGPATEGLTPYDYEVNDGIMTVFGMG